MVYQTAAGPSDKKIKGGKTSFDHWRVLEALRTLVEADKIRNDPDLMQAISTIAKKQLDEQKLGIKTMAKLAD
jgi:hypothetical protein